MTQQNAALVEQAAAAAQSLKEQAMSLQRAAAAFHVDDAGAGGSARFAPAEGRWRDVVPAT
jgi:methyl-accepting chemotaxis protein